MNLIKIWIYSLISVLIGLFATFYLRVSGLGTILFGSSSITSNLTLIFILRILLTFLAPLITIGIPYILIRKKHGAQTAKSFLIRAIIILIIGLIFFFPYLFGSWKYNIERFKLSIQPALELKESKDLKNNIKSDSQPLENLKSTDESEIANWKTYQSSRLGFEIKYPENWVSEEKYKHINQVGFYPTGTPPLYSGGTEILPLIDFHEIGPQKVERDLYSLMDKKKYKIGDIEIIKFIPTDDMSKLDTIIYLGNGKIYEVWVDDEARETFNKILPTLKNIK